MTRIPVQIAHYTGELLLQQMRNDRMDLVLECDISKHFVIVVIFIWLNVQNSISFWNNQFTFYPSFVQNVHIERFIIYSRTADNYNP